MVDVAWISNSYTFNVDIIIISLIKYYIPVQRSVKENSQVRYVTQVLTQINGVWCVPWKKIFHILEALKNKVNIRYGLDWIG